MSELQPRLIDGLIPPQFTKAQEERLEDFFSALNINPNPAEGEEKITPRSVVEDCIALFVNKDFPFALSFFQSDQPTAMIVKENGRQVDLGGAEIVAGADRETLLNAVIPQALFWLAVRFSTQAERALAVQGLTKVDASIFFYLNNRDTIIEMLEEAGHIPSDKVA